ncbi:MAG: hypothetical protein HQK51_14865 [Oligoflexia bacterium]|nr:hypothetical protein [Oligoflexia bacterium]
MENAYLKPGQTTILSFLEKPTRVVIGNKNYFNVEYVNNDVSIQPQQMVTDSNLFVYGKYHRYGFILKVIGVTNYDDLIKVRWLEKDSIEIKSGDDQKMPEKKKQQEQLAESAQSPPVLATASVPAPVATPVLSPTLMQTIEVLTVIFQKSIWLAERKLLLVDLEITNQKNEMVNLKDLKVIVKGLDAKVPPILKEMVFEIAQLPKASDKTRGRLIILLPNASNINKEEITLEITYYTLKKVITIKGGSY